MSETDRQREKLSGMYMRLFGAWAVMELTAVTAGTVLAGAGAVGITEKAAFYIQDRDNTLRHASEGFRNKIKRRPLVSFRQISACETVQNHALSLTGYFTACAVGGVLLASAWAGWKLKRPLQKAIEDPPMPPAKFSGTHFPPKP